MRIKDIRRVQQAPSPRGFITLLKFSFEPCEGVLVYDCCLVETPDGRHLFYGPPSKHSATVLSLAPAIRHELVQLAINEIGNNDNNDINEYANAA